MSNNGFPSKVLFVEDQMAGTSDLFSLLENQGIKVLAAVDLSTALYQLHNNFVEVVAISNEFAELSGTAVAQKVRSQENNEKRAAGIIIMSSARELKKTDITLHTELGGIEVINKPFKPVQMLPYLKRALSYRTKELAYLDLNTKVIGYHRKTGNFEKAVEAVKKKLPEIGEKGPHLLLDLYVEGEKNEEALELVSGLIERSDKDDIRLINKKGMLLMKMGQLEEAKECLEKADELAPSNIARMSEMAEMYLKNNEPDKSVDMFKQVIDLKPENPDEKFDIFDKLIDNGYAEHAQKLCHQTTVPMEIVRHYNNKGVMLSKEGKFLEAITLYKQALVYYPKAKDNFRIFFNIALAHVNSKEKGYLQEAMDSLEQCMKLNPDFEKAKNTMATLKEALDKSKAKKKKTS